MGFTTSTTAFCIFKADAPANVDYDQLRKFAFTPDIDADGKRMGWVGIGDPLDTDFVTGIDFAGYAAFSLRIDTKKAPGAAVKLQLAEAIQQEQDAGKKVSGKRKKELKEAITAKLMAKADFQPSLIDCLWDLERGRLLVSATSTKAAQPVLDYFARTFGITPTEVYTPEPRLPELLAKICRDGDYKCNGFTIVSMASGAFVTPEQAEEKSTVAIQNNADAMMQAMSNGMVIKKLHMLATSDDNADLQYEFSLDNALVVSGLKMPKADKDAEADAELLLKAETCGDVSELVMGLIL